MSNLYTPSPFKVCPECKGKKVVSSTSASYEGYAKDITCPTCHGTGRIPIYYTVKRWEELIGRKVTDDDPIWYLGNDNLWHKGDDTVDAGYCDALRITCVIHLFGQPRPPKNWRPE